MNISKESLRKLLEDCWDACIENMMRPHSDRYEKPPKHPNRDTYITTRLAALDDGDDWEKLKEISDSPEKWLKMYDDYSEMLTKEDVASWWHDQYLIANAERNELKQKAKPVDDGQEGKGLRWVKASERLPEVNDLYHTNIQMRDTDLDTFPSTNNYFTKSGWEIADDYEVIEWLDEGQPEQGGKPFMEGKDEK